MMVPDEWLDFEFIRDRIRRVQRMRRRVSCVGDLFARVTGSDAERRYWRAFVTLTYRDAADWRPFHISTFVRACRRHVEARGAKFRYVWVAELQERGAIHYHLIIWLPEGVMLPKPDSSGWWAHGFSNIQRARGKGVGYLLKYVSKGSVRLPFPIGARMYGFGGLSMDLRDEASWWGLPRYVRKMCYWFERVRREPGAGWFSPATGRRWPGWEFYKPYYLQPGGVVCLQSR